MVRNDFLRLAELRIAEASLLLAHKLYDGTYYLAGYAVECGLKACIPKQTRLHDFPPPRRVVDDCYTHDVERLLKSAGLTKRHDDEMRAIARFKDNWEIVRGWDESSRYDRKTRAEAKSDAEALVGAITDPAHGVLPWIKRYC